VTETLEYLKMFARFPLALRRFLRHRLTVHDAIRIVRERMEHREERFLNTLERRIYGYPGSPYLRLLEAAGCELGDVKELVKRRGLEGALQALRDAEVYVTFEEFKGRRPILRSGTEIEVTPRDFDNPSIQRHFLLETGGSTGVAAKVYVDLDQMAARAPSQMLTLAAHGIMGAPTAEWGGMLPHGKVGAMLRRAYIGQVPERWFSPIGWLDSRYWMKYGAATCYFVLWMRLLGLPVPLPEIVRVDQAVVIARWIGEVLETHERCLLNTQVSRGVRVCLAAREAGIDLKGAAIKGGGEPATAAKVRQMEEAGARYISNYGMTEAGSIGSGCAHPLDGSDVHLFKDAYALVTSVHTVDGTELTVPAFNLTTLLPTAPKVMLNVEVGDYGIVEERHCGCQLESYGYTTHLRQVRSYSKLTGEGATLLGTEMEHILQDVLPSRFGGSPLDYQIIEREDEQGFTRIYLAISPGVAIVDESTVIEVMLNALGRSSPPADAARAMWQQAHTIQVKRMDPLWTGRGKLMSLHTEPHGLSPSPGKERNR